MSEIKFFTSTSYITTDDSGNPITRYDVAGQETSVISSYLSAGYDFKSVVSLDEMFSPYSTIAGSGNIIPYASFAPRPTGVSPGSGDSRSEIISYDVRSGVNVGICPTFYTDLDNPNVNSAIVDKNDTVDIRSMAFRSPMMVAGFGYDTEGFPTPSVYDDTLRYKDPTFILSKEPNSGDYPGNFSQYTADSGLWVGSGNAINYQKRQFAFNFRDRPDEWNSGPLDLRWDKYKKMYVAAPEVFVGYALQDIPVSDGRYGEKTFTSGEIEVYTGRYDSFGITDRNKSQFPGYANKLLIINRSVDKSIDSGTMVIAIRTNNGEYMPIWVDCDADLGSN